MEVAVLYFSKKELTHRFCILRLAPPLARTTLPRMNNTAVEKRSRRKWISTWKSRSQCHIEIWKGFRGYTKRFPFHPLLFVMHLACCQVNQAVGRMREM